MVSVVGIVPFFTGVTSSALVVDKVAHGTEAQAAILRHRGQRRDANLDGLARVEREGLLAQAHLLLSEVDLELTALHNGLALLIKQDGIRNDAVVGRRDDNHLARTKNNLRGTAAA